MLQIGFHVLPWGQIRRTFHPNDWHGFRIPSTPSARELVAIHGLQPDVPWDPVRSVLPPWVSLRTLTEGGRVEGDGGRGAF